MTSIMRLVGLVCLLGLLPVSARAELYLYTASSMIPAAESLSREFGARVVAAASGTLARQLAQGAPPGVFISAHQGWIGYLEQEGLVEASRTLASNRLVLAAPCHSQFRFAFDGEASLHEVLAGGRLGMADPSLVPLGAYAREAMISLGVWPEVKNHAVFASSAADGLAWLLRGEVKAGLIYASDKIGRESHLCEIALVPHESHAPIIYHLALMRGAPEAARQFYEFAASEEASEILRRHGFSRLP